MKNSYFEVILTGYTAYITAMGERAAIILAQAEAIHECRNYDFVSIRKIESDEYWVLKNRQLKVNQSVLSMSVQ